MVSEEQRPLVSIVCITFNQERFIRKALDGFLAQHTSFPFEVIVHDDASTDNTAAIIREIATRHPDVIVPILQNENQYSKGNKPWLICFPRARGSYIALCEGDDHWVDSLKLQKQVDALQADPKAVACYANAYNESDGVREPYHGGLYRVPDGTVLDEEQYIAGASIPTCTFMFRQKSLKKDFGTFMKDFLTGDTALFTQLIPLGHFIYIPEIMGVRVRHEGGTYSMKGALHHLRVTLHNLPVQDRSTQGRYAHLIRARRLFALKSAWNEALHHQNWELAQEAWRHLRKERAEMGWSLSTTWFNGMLVHFPGLVARLVRLKHALIRLPSDPGG